MNHVNDCEGRDGTSRIVYTLGRIPGTHGRDDLYEDSMPDVLVMCKDFGSENGID